MLPTHGAIQGIDEAAFLRAVVGCAKEIASSDLAGVFDVGYWNGGHLVFGFDQFWELAFPAVLGHEYWSSAEIQADFPIAVSVLSTLQELPVSGAKAVEFPSPSTGQTAQLDQEIELAVGQRADYGGDLSVEFWNVPADSRCPVDGLILCVWEGEAVIDLKAQGGSGVSSFIQLTNYGDRNVARFEDFSIELLEVEPEPVSTHPIAIGDYRIRLRVSSEGTDQ